MTKVILKIFLFPLLGILSAIAYPFYVGDNFREEEIKFEAHALGTDIQPNLKGVAETDWNGKKVLRLEGSQASFPFSILRKTTFFLQTSYYLRSGGAFEKIKLLINDSLLAEVLLKPTLNSPGQFSALIPFYNLKEQNNVLTIMRSGVEPTSLYIDSLKLRNYRGYSSGIIKAHILPHPLNPSLHSRIQWNVHKNILLLPVAYSLFGFVYGFIVSRLRKSPFLPSIGEGTFVLLPVFCFLLTIAAISQLNSGHIILSLKSFVILTAGLTLVAVAVQLRLIQPLWKSIKSIFGRRDLVVLLLISAVFLSVLFLFSLKVNKNITGFMVIGDYFKAPQIWTAETLIHKGSVGYDGQFYYYIAHDPFLLGQSYDHIDFPAYRYQRIVYPLAAWLLSFGQPPLIPWMMVAVNLLGILLGTWFLILILKHFGRSPWYSLFYPASWGFLLCLLRSLPEPLAMTFLVIAVFFYLKGKPFRQIIALSLAGLTQETTLLVSMAFLFYSFGKKEFLKSLYMLFPLLTYFFWQLFLYVHFQTFSFLGGTQNFGLPFQGIMEKFLSLGHGSLSFEKTSELLFLLLISFLIITALYDIFKYYSPLTLSFLGYALITALLNHLIWVEPWSYARATLGLLVFNLLIFTKYGRKLNLLPMFLIPVIFLLSLFSMRLL